MYLAIASYTFQLLPIVTKSIDESIRIVINYILPSFLLLRNLGIEPKTSYSSADVEYKVFVWGADPLFSKFPLDSK